MEENKNQESKEVLWLKTNAHRIFFYLSIAVMFLNIFWITIYPGVNINMDVAIFFMIVAAYYKIK